jgi:hypothetical protein
MSSFDGSSNFSSLLNASSNAFDGNNKGISLTLAPSSSPFKTFPPSTTGIPLPNGMQFSNESNRFDEIQKIIAAELDNVNANYPQSTEQDDDEEEGDDTTKSKRKKTRRYKGGKLMTVFMS